MSNAITIAGLIAIAATLPACSENNPDAANNQTKSGNTAAESTVPAAPVQQGALGLTMGQLSEAEILNANGIEIAEVERVITNSSGAVTKLLVEIEDSNPDRYVELALDGLTPAQQGDDWDLQSTLTKEDLMALPEVK